MNDCTSSDYLITATASGYNIGHVIIVTTNSVRAVSPSGISVSNEGKIAFCRLTGNSGSTGIDANSANADCVYNTITGGYTTNLNANGHMADAKIERNVGFVTEAKGTSSITSGNTFVDVTHGLAYTPVLGDIRITFSQQATNDYGRFWIDNITSTQFRLNVSANPGASGLGFGWSIAPR